MNRTRVTVRFLATLVLVVAGTAVVGQAANLGISSDKLSAVSATVPVCASGSVTVTTTHAGPNLSKITLKLTSCAGAIATDTLYAVLAETTTPTHSIGHGTCVLAGAPASCAVSMTVTYSLADSYSLEILAEPGVTGTTSSSANLLKLNSQYLTLRTCTTVSAGPPATC
jgi:hypothetical protein